ncbi:hypothetical protein DFQ30_006699 [Apophysomyces sp. BC1015]|nr:hypothetical protein DFQ30_006699 [Apophysomyces sp. BC1015]
MRIAGMILTDTGEMNNDTLQFRELSDAFDWGRIEYDDGMDRIEYEIFENAHQKMKSDPRSERDAESNTKHNVVPISKSVD